MAGEVCPHDKLRRNCDVCDLEADNAALRKRVEELEKSDTRLRQHNAALRAECEAWRALRNPVSEGEYQRDMDELDAARAAVDRLGAMEGEK